MKTNRGITHLRYVLSAIVMSIFVAAPTFAEAAEGECLNTRRDGSPIVVDTGDDVTINVERQVPRNPLELEQLKPREIARPHRRPLLRVAEPEAVDETVQKLIDQAEAAIEKGDYDAADTALKRAQEIQDRIVAKAEEPFLAAAELRARRAELKATWFEYEEAGRLYLEGADLVPGTRPLEKADYLQAAARAFSEAALFDQAEALYKRALAIREEKQGKDHLDVAGILKDQAYHYQYQRRYEEAETLYKRALAITEAGLGKEHPDVAEILDDLGSLYIFQRRLDEAETLHKQSLAIKEARLGKEHPSLATTLTYLAWVYTYRGRPDDAGTLLKRALRINDAGLGTEHPLVAQSLQALAIYYEIRERFGEAEQLYRHAIKIYEARHGREHPSVVRALISLAFFYEQQGRYDEAVPLYRRVLKIYEARLGRDHRRTQLVREMLEKLEKLMKEKKD